MTSAPSYTGPLILDACVLINLLATGMVSDIVDAQASPSIICRHVAVEALVLDQPDGTRARVQPDGLPVVDLETDDEYDDFVRLAMELGDGEAATIALANPRGYVVCTDDRKASRIAGDRGLVTLDTVDLLRTWATIAGDDVVEAIARIEQRASFKPRSAHPHAAWWAASARSASVAPSG